MMQKTILDLYTVIIYKKLRITSIPLCDLKSLKIKQEQNDWSVETNIKNDKYTSLNVSLLVKTSHHHYYIKRCEKHFNVIRLLNMK